MSAKKQESPSLDCFETSLAELEKIVGELENGELSLHEMIHHYERGSDLLTACDAILKNARMRLEKVSDSSAQDTKDLLDR